MESSFQPFKILTRDISTTKILSPDFSTAKMSTQAFCRFQVYIDPNSMADILGSDVIIGPNGIINNFLSNCRIFDTQVAYLTKKSNKFRAH